MPHEVPLWRVRCRAVWDFVWHVFKAVLGTIGRIICGMFDSLFHCLAEVGFWSAIIRCNWTAHVLTGDAAVQGNLRFPGIS
ncbi:MAG: hypothetical protein NT013_18605 [Planctomycetia bacterium]|nr:hypothetical protein [Planctomycetia bacterium]